MSEVGLSVKKTSTLRFYYNSLVSQRKSWKIYSYGKRNYTDESSMDVKSMS